MTHFIGIGGIGMSALARFLLLKNQKVSGSDVKASERLTKLKELGAEINLGHNLDNFSEVEKVVVSTSIEETNQELMLAKAQNIPVLHRSDLLKEIMSSYRSICVTGAHGKTSSSALLSWVLFKAKLNPSFVIGGILKDFDQNSHLGKGEFFVAEADESDGSFLNVEYEKALITNADIDHINYWKDQKTLETAYLKFMKLTPKKKDLFMCGDDPFLSNHADLGTLYGFSSQCSWKIQNYQQIGLGSQFDILHEDKVYLKVRLNLPGMHYALNATGVFALAMSLGISEERIRRSFETFPGVKRRMDRLYSTEKIDIFDDYAHHPKEIMTLYKAMRAAFPKRRLIAVFEPHRYSRLSSMESEFIQALSNFNVVISTEVFSAGEFFLDKNLFERFSEKVDRVILKKDLLKDLRNLTCEKDVIVFIGAGEISCYAHRFALDFSGAQ